MTRKIVALWFVLDDLENAVMDFKLHTRSEKFHEEQKRICTYREFIRILEDHLKM